MITLILFLFQLLLPHPAFAAITTPTLSPTIVPSITPTETPSNLEEIQKIRKAVQDKVKEKLQEIVNTENKKKGVLGNIISVDNATIVISHPSGDKTIVTDESTTIVDVNRKQIDTSKLKAGQSILAMGYENSDSILEAKRIVVNDPNYLPVKKIITIGKIVDRSTTSDVATLIPSNNKNNQYQIAFTAQTTISDSAGKKLQLKDIVTGKKVIVILTSSTKTKSLTADSVYIVE